MVIGKSASLGAAEEMRERLLAEAGAETTASVTDPFGNIWYIATLTLKTKG